jgi:hypothetical protein
MLKSLAGDSQSHGAATNQHRPELDGRAEAIGANEAANLRAFEKPNHGIHGSDHTNTEDTAF